MVLPTRERRSISDDSLSKSTELEASGERLTGAPSIMILRPRSNRELYRDPSMKFWKAKLTIEYKVLKDVLKQMLDELRR